MLKQIFRDREKWKQDTFNRIKSRLLSVKDNRFIQYSQSTATHLVCVYGKTQVGKTTLILNMIGLKDDKCKMEVSEVLRGGVARGNSSTSTAIIYSQSDSDLYGVRTETLDGNITESTEYFTPDEMCRKLQSVRKKVEENSFSNKSILHIFIPKDLFSASVSTNKVSILDLPGVESSNFLEKAHVESLMNRYIPISSVCVIVSTANTIQSLEVEEMPNGVEWKHLPHKYLVVLTRSYSSGSIKCYFDKSREEREKGFLEHVQDCCRDEMSKILGNNNKTEIFPLEFGDSFERLLLEELKNEEDRNEIRQTRDYVLSSLQESMIKNKGEQLLSIIKELRIIVEQSDEKKLSTLKEEKMEYEKDRDRKEKKLSGFDDQLNGNHYPGEFDLLREDENKKQDLENEIAGLCDKRLKVEGMLKTDVPVFSRRLIETIRQIVDEKGLSKNKGGEIYLFDKNEVVLETISSFLLNQLNVSIVSTAKSLMQDCGLNVDLYDQSIAGSIYNSFVNQYANQLYPHPKSLWDRLKQKLRSGCTVYLDVALGYIARIEDIIHDEIVSSVISPCKKAIDKSIEDLEVEIKKVNGEIIKKNNKIERLKKDIDEINKKIEDNEFKVSIVVSQKEQDLQTLNTYMKYAEEAYIDQKRDIINKINTTISPSEKLLYVLFLGVVEKDFETIKNASYE